MNLLILGLCLIKVLVYGDPIMNSKSKESITFWRHRQQSEFNISKVRCLTVCPRVAMIYHNDQYCKLVRYISISKTLDCHNLNIKIRTSTKDKF